MWNTYKTKQVQKEAIQITDFTTLDFLCSNKEQGMAKYSLYSDLLQQEVKFTFAQPIHQGDYIIKESDTDIYHVPREVFEKKYEKLGEDEEEINTIIIYDTLGDSDLSFVVVDRDVSELNGVYINECENEDLVDKLNSILEGVFYHTRFPVEYMKPNTKVITCGFIY